MLLNCSLYNLIFKLYWGGGYPYRAVYAVVHAGSLPHRTAWLCGGTSQSLKFTSPVDYLDFLLCQTIQLKLYAASINFTIEELKIKLRKIDSFHYFCG